MGSNISTKSINLFRLTSPEYIPLGLAGIVFGFFVSISSFGVSFKLLYGLISIIFLIAGYNSFNAVFDIDIDRINKPNRPLPKGVLTREEALTQTFLLFILSIGFSALIGTLFTYLVLLGVVISIVYSLPPIHLKKRFILGTLSAGFLYQILPIICGWVISGGSYVNVLIITLGLFPFFFGCGILKDFEDVLGDNEHRAHTIINKIRYPKTIRLVYTLFILSVLIISYMAIIGLIKIYYLGSIFFILIALTNVHMFNKRRNTKQGRSLFHHAMIIIILLEIFIAMQAIYFLWI